MDDSNGATDDSYEVEDYSDSDDTDGEETWIAAEMLEQGNSSIATHNNQLSSFEMASDFHTSTLDPEAADTSANLTIADSSENTQDTPPTALPLLVLVHFIILLCSVGSTPKVFVQFKNY